MYRNSVAALMVLSLSANALGQDPQLDQALIAQECDPAVFEELKAANERARSFYVSAKYLDEPVKLQEYTCVLDIFNDRLGGFIKLPSLSDIMDAIQKGLCRKAQRYVRKGDRWLYDNLSYDVRIPGQTLPGDIRIPGAGAGTTTRSPQANISVPIYGGRKSSTSRSSYLDALYGEEPKKGGDQ